MKIDRRPFVGWLACFVACLFAGATSRLAAGEPLVLNVWPDKPPGETKELPAESDLTKPKDNLVGGRRIIKLGNVSTPQIAVHRPDPARDTGASVVICPGGGHHILAYDLEGTEVADWLNSLGVTGVVLKYRVPFRDPEQKWRAAVQDAQRAVSLVRSRASEWKLDPRRVGVCGFSAGGQTAAMASLAESRLYDRVDAADEPSYRADFALLVYPAWLVEAEDSRLRSELKITRESPPTFFVHAFNDPITVQSSLLLASGLKRAGVSAELHVFATGGHGYGLRPTSEAVTRWPQRAGEWLREQGWLAPRR